MKETFCILYWYIYILYSLWVLLARIHFLCCMQYIFSDFYYFCFRCLLFYTIHNCKIIYIKQFFLNSILLSKQNWNLTDLWYKWLWYWFQICFLWISFYDALKNIVYNTSSSVNNLKMKTLHNIQNVCFIFCIFWSWKW